MKRLSLLLAASAAFATPALAADVVYEEPPAPAPMMIEPVATTPTWTGIYIGGQAGVAFGQDGNGINFDSDQDGIFGDGNFNSDENAGFVGGAHLGYDYQFQNNIVLGAVADINYIDAETSRSYSIDGASLNVNEDINYLGTVRARLGYAMDSVLLYGTGGLAYAGTDRDSGLSNVATGSFAGYSFDSDGDDADIGYSVGGGVDVMATQNLSFGVEYLYTNLGSNDFSVEGTNGTNEVNFTTNSDDDLDFHTVWAKASYHFN